MPKPGPRPIPTKLKELAGNPGRRKLNDAEPRFPAPRRLPSPPVSLSEEAAAIWRKLGKYLLDTHLLTFVDVYALEMFCVSTARWRKAERKVRLSDDVIVSKKTGALYQNPWLGVANRAWKQMQLMFGEFGLTPAERSRLKIIVQEDEPSLADVLFQMATKETDG